MSTDTLHLDHRLVLQLLPSRRAPHHEPSASLSHDQLGQLRRRGWGERVAAQPPQSAPCARRAPTLPRKAVGSVLREADLRLEEASRRCWWRSRAPFSPSALKQGSPRFLPHMRLPTPMSFHRVLRASASPVHVSWWRAPSSAAAARSVRGAAASPAADSDPCMFSTE